ncbi:MAG: thioredoxin [Myxococcales bacterium]|nr:thioredoxin [Myxococcales bacterium]USN50195.1 MAG: thioredoxin [Myxococcales bacterium]
MSDNPHIKTLTDSNFDAEVKQQNVPVLVDFWAAWCAPCRAIAPHLEDLASKYNGQAVVAKLNVDEQPQTAGNLGIRALPTLLLFKNGQVVEQMVGAVSKDRIDALIKSHI